MQDNRNVRALPSPSLPRRTLHTTPSLSTPLCDRDDTDRVAPSFLGGKMKHAIRYDLTCLCLCVLNLSASHRYADGKSKKDFGTFLEYSPRGGVIADGTGLGKTATVLGLIFSEPKTTQFGACVRCVLTRNSFSSLPCPTECPCGIRGTGHVLG